MSKLNVFIKENGFSIEAELLSMAITGDRCVVLAQDRVAIAWLTGDIWELYDMGLDLFDDPRYRDEDGDDNDDRYAVTVASSEEQCIRCTHDGSCQFQENM